MKGLDSKLDSIMEAFNIPKNDNEPQLDDKEIEEEATKLGEEIKPEVKEKTVNNSSQLESETDSDSTEQE